MAMALLLAKRSLKRQRILRDRSNPLDYLNDKELIARYSFPRHCMDQLLEMVSEDIAASTKRSSPLPASMKLLLTLEFLATGTFYRQTGSMYEVDKSTVSRTIQTVTSALKKQVSHFIKFPTDIPAQVATKNGVAEIAGFPNVLGAVDGTLIPILTPSLDEPSYVCRKHYHAINVQAISDAKMRFLSVVAKWPGSTHDSFIFTTSQLNRAFEEGLIGDGWLLGDSGYALRPWLLTPLAAEQSDADRNYNRAHKKTRSVIERAFGVLKMRFGCLHRSRGTLLLSPSRCIKVILACFILHNYAISHNVPHNYPDQDFMDADGDDAVYLGPITQDGNTVRRSLIANKFASQ